MTTIDWATGVIMLVFGIGLLTITTALALAAVALARLLGRGVLSAARWSRRRGTPGAWTCPECKGGLTVCTCPPEPVQPHHVPSWAKQDGDL